MVISKIVAVILDILADKLLPCLGSGETGEAVSGAWGILTCIILSERESVTICGGTQPKTETTSLKKYDAV